jgi:hypothetical protein
VIRLLLSATLLLSSCLPRQALSRRDEVEADRYRLSMELTVSTSGVPLDPFVWRLEGDLGWSFTRSFRDGSLGHLVRFDGLQGQIERAGSVRAVPAVLGEALFELRAFGDGEVLVVSGAPAWAGEAGHSEHLDLLWALLSPHVPGREDAGGGMVTSVPAWVDSGPRVRTRLRSTWSEDGDRLRYAGDISSEGGGVRGAGTFQGELTLGGREARVRTHAITWSREWETRWPGAAVTQQVDGRATLTWLGDEPAPPLDMPLGMDDRNADATPLRLRDGRTVTDPPSVPAGPFPFLLVPDDLPVEEREALRSALVGAGTMPGSEPRP